MVSVKTIYNCLTVFLNFNFFWPCLIFCDKILKCHKNVISVTKSWMARFYMFSGDDIILTFYRCWLLRFVMWVIDVTFYRSSTGFFTFNNIPRQIFELDWSQDFRPNLELKNLTPGMSECPKLGQVIVFHVLTSLGMSEVDTV